MGQKVRESSREYILLGPRITFPNALGGRDTFAPIRAQLLGPDMRRWSSYARDISIRMMQGAVARRREGEPEPEQSRVAGQHRSARSPRISACECRISPSAVRLLMSGEDEISTFKEGLGAVSGDHAPDAGPARRPECAQPVAGALGKAGTDPPRLDRQARARTRSKPHRPFQPPVRRRHLWQRRRHGHSLGEAAAVDAEDHRRGRACRRATRPRSQARSRFSRRPR